jgi:hypothetical protein
MKLRRPEKIRSHTGVLLVVGVVVLLVSGIWAFQLTSFFQDRLQEVPDTVISTQQLWDEAIAESEDVSEDLPLIQGDTDDIAEEVKRILRGDSKEDTVRQAALDEIAEDLLTELERTNVEENQYAEEE